MNAQQVVEKILAQARAEADAIMTDAKAKAQAVQTQTQSDLDAFNKQTEALAQAAAEDKLRRMQAAARMANAKEVLAVKSQILDETFQKAMQKLNLLPDEQYLELMKKLMLRAIETGDEEVIVGKNEKRINDDFIKKVNRELATGIKGNLRLSAQRADISGGFLLSRGRVQINVSTDVLIRQIRESLEMELANELFG